MGRCDRGQEGRTPRLGVKELEFNEKGFPIRPGQQKCGMWLRSGTCNWGANCRFDHPAGLGGLMAGSKGIGEVPFSLMLGGVTSEEPFGSGAPPRRPGQAQCQFLQRTGKCPFGPECRFDHQPLGESDATGGAPQIGFAVARAAAPPEQGRKSMGLGGVKGKRPVAASRRDRAPY